MAKHHLLDGTVARPKKGLLRGYPRNVKGWKKIFFFVSGDGWEFPKGAGREVGVPMAPRSWGVPRDEPDRFGEVASSIEQKGLYSGPNLLKSKTFYRCFKLSKPKVPRMLARNDLTLPPHRAMWVSLAIPEMIYPEATILEIAR
ncbi:hypothetical protein Acr_24g0004050 [Actinidia rufa]|uniref:Uncharacterized protein n=1 Tax=Actinidia rufa TaxID=165716 RepID=A0A7J0GTP0_9ERIC|nr:hypothetical protein Acr_24g0004050 [Actinidia rufa]